MRFEDRRWVTRRKAADFGCGLTQVFHNEFVKRAVSASSPPSTLMYLR
jgi:hypothetical protein